MGWSVLQYFIFVTITGSILSKLPIQSVSTDCHSQLPSYRLTRRNIIDLLACCCKAVKYDNSATFFCTAKSQYYCVSSSSNCKTIYKCSVCRSAKSLCCQQSSYSKSKCMFIKSCQKNVCLSLSSVLVVMIGSFVWRNKIINSFLITVLCLRLRSFRRNNMFPSSGEKINHE